MIRTMVFVGAVALTAVQPVATLGAPASGLSAYRPVMVAHRPAPVSAPAERVGPRDSFKLPFDVDTGPRPLPEASRSTLFSSKPREWQSIPGYGWYQPACYLNNGAANPFASVTAPMTAPATDFTIGSLVDGHSQNLFSPTASHGTGLASPGSGNAALSGPLTVQYGFQTNPCGAASSLNP